MSTVYKAQDVVTIRATIKNEGIDPIQGGPSCYTLIKLLNQLCEGAKQVECEYSVFSMMWCCLSQQLYQALTGENIVAPLQPPAIPSFNNLATPCAQCGNPSHMAKEQGIMGWKEKCQQGMNQDRKRSTWHCTQPPTHQFIHQHPPTNLLWILRFPISKMGPGQPT